MSKERETIGSRFGFIMLAAGCAIGLGNVWRFPYMTGEHGGALFVLLYLLFLVILGFPVMCMELALGRASGRGMYGAFRNLPDPAGPSKWKYPAGALFFGNLILMIMYTTVTGWMIAYCVDFFTGSLSNLNTAKEIENRFAELLSNPGKMGAYMLLTTLLGSIVCAVGLRNGVERITKILMTGLFLLLLCLCAYSLTLPGAGVGMKFYLMPDASKLASSNLLRTIAGAMAQAFFTLSLGIGSVAIFGSYINKKHSLASESVLIILCDTLVALLSGVVIFASCFSYGMKVNTGPGLVLVSLTGIFNNLPLGRLWGTLFFLFLSIAAMTTVIAVFENLIAFMIDEWHFSRMKATWINFAAVTLLSIPCVLGFNILSNFHPLGGDSTVLDLEDWLVSDLFLPIGSLLVVLFCGWSFGWGWKNFCNEVNLGEGVRFPAWTRTYVRYILPLLIVFLLGLGFYDRFIK